MRNNYITNKINDSYPLSPFIFNIRQNDLVYSICSTCLSVMTSNLPHFRRYFVRSLTSTFLSKFLFVIVLFFIIITCTPVFSGEPLRANNTLCVFCTQFIIFSYLALSRNVLTYFCKTKQANIDTSQKTVFPVLKRMTEKCNSILSKLAFTKLVLKRVLFVHMPQYNKQIIFKSFLPSTSDQLKVVFLCPKSAYSEQARLFVYSTNAVVS